MLVIVPTQKFLGRKYINKNVFFLLAFKKKLENFKKKKYKSTITK